MLAEQWDVHLRILGSHAEMLPEKEAGLEERETKGRHGQGPGDTCISWARSCQNRCGDLQI